MSRRAIRSKPPATGRCCAWRRAHAAEIDRRYPKILRRVGGYNLDEFVDSSKPVNLAKIMVGSEGTLGIVLEAKLRLVPLPKAKAVMVIMFADLLEALAAAPGDSAPQAFGGRGDGQIHPRSHARRTRRSTASAATYIEGDPAATLCVEFYADRKEDLPPRLAALEAGSARAQARLCLPSGDRPGGAGADLEPARSGAGPFDGDEGRRQIDLLCRRHGGRAGEAARFHRPLSADHPQARNHGGHLRARFGGLPARAAR